MPKPRVYLDACVFLSYLGHDAGRSADIKAVFERSATGDVELFTSTMTIVEVAFAASEKAGRALSDEEEARIDDLISTVHLVEFHDGIAREARRLRRVAMTKHLKLRTMDAIHLATAKLSGCTELHTYNLRDFVSFAEDIGCSVTAPTGGQVPLLVEEVDVSAGAPADNAP
jgi:predicted nucleic acid-binding protein